MFTVLAPVHTLQSNPSGSSVLVPALAAVDGGVGEQLFVTSRNRDRLHDRPQTSRRFSFTLPALAAFVGDEQPLLASIAQTCKAMCPTQLYQRTFTLAEVHARVQRAVSEALVEWQQAIANAVEETLGHISEALELGQTHHEFDEVVEYGMTTLVSDIGCQDELRNSAYFRRSMVNSASVGRSMVGNLQVARSLQPSNAPEDDVDAPNVVEEIFH